MKKSRFNEDKRKEELFGVWLDNHFYKQMQKSIKALLEIQTQHFRKEV